jgi:quercetin dioxygenase-like cupin family protein
MLALAGATMAFATPPSGETITPLARAPLAKPANLNVKTGSTRVRIRTQGALDALTLQNTLAPGGSAGWHKLAGPHIAIVTQGTLTVIDARCQRHDLSAGHANIDSGASVEKAENLGSTPVVVYVTLLVPHGVTSPRIDEPAPPGCDA